MVMDVEVKKLLKQYPVFEEGEFHKLHCKLTGHDVPAKYQQIKDYISTKKFQTAFKVHEILEANPNVFEDLDEDNVIGCKITKTVIAKDPKDLEAHLSGKKFKKALARGVTADEEEEAELPSDDSEMEAEVSDVEESGSELEPEPEPSRKGKKKEGSKAACKAKQAVETVESVASDDYDFSAAMDTEELPKKQLKRKGPEEGSGKKKKREN